MTEGVALSEVVPRCLRQKVLVFASPREETQKWSNSVSSGGGYSYWPARARPLTVRFPSYVHNNLQIPRLRILPINKLLLRPKLLPQRPSLISQGQKPRHASRQLRRRNLPPPTQLLRRGRIGPSPRACAGSGRHSSLPLACARWRSS